jgi:drug/metabolite transporter superfamily protein YnfA
VGTEDAGTLPVRQTEAVAFAVAAFFENAGCFAFWTWLRRAALRPWLTVLRIVSFVSFAIA